MKHNLKIPNQLAKKIFDRQKIKKKTISACLIVKNEAHCLEQCLESISGLVDEIIIVDTGSTDQTLEIAQRYTTKIFSSPWNHHFAQARNIALNHATGDWILTIDADEILLPESAHKIVQYISHPEIQDRPCVLNFRVRSEYHEDLYSRGLFPNGFGIRFEGRVHEVPSLPNTNLPSFNCPDLAVWHNSSGILNLDKQRYYQTLLLQSLEEEQTLVRLNHIQKHLGLNHLILQEWSAAWDMLSSCYQGLQILEISPEDGFYREVLKGLVHAGSKIGNTETSLYAQELVSHYPLESVIYQDQDLKAWRKSIVVMSLCLLAACQPSSTMPVTNHSDPAQQKSIFLEVETPHNSKTKIPELQAAQNNRLVAMA